MKHIPLIFISLLCFCLVGCTLAPKELHTAEQLMDTAPDSAFEILKQINPSRLFTPSHKALYALLMSQALDKNDIKVESDSLIHIATNYYTESEPQHAAYAWFYSARVANNKGEAKTQADALLKAQEYAEKTENNKLKGLVYADKGSMYKTQGQSDSAICYYKRSCKSLFKIKDKRNYVINLLNIGAEHLKFSRFDSVIINYFLAEKMAKKLNDTLLLSAVYRNLGAVYLKQKDYNQALSYYKKVPVTAAEIYNSNKWFLQANVYVRIGNTDSARYCLNQVKELNEMAPDYYVLWQQVYEKEGNLNQALLFATKATNAIDSLYKTKLNVSFAGLETKYKFQGLKVDNQQLIIKNKQYGIVILIVLLMLSMFALVVSLWQIKVKKQQVESEMKQLEAQKQLVLKDRALVEKEKERLEKEIENNALLAKHLNFREIMLLNIEQHRSNSIKRPSLWKNGSKKLNAELNALLYKELIACMDLEYNNISVRLQIKYKKLTQHNILMCCMLLADFKTGMIATVMDIELESVNKNRHQLRAKLFLQTSVNLELFLVQF